MNAAWELLRRGLFERLETLLTSPLGFCLSTATPLQRAVCRAAEGREIGELWGDEDVRAALGGVCPSPGMPPEEFFLLAAIRCAKSLLAAAIAVRATQTCDVSRLGKGEIPRVSVVSIRLDLAQVIHGHIVGNVMGSPVMSKLVVGDPTADGITLRHPTGRPVEIRTVAGSRAGATLVSRWSAGAIFDEWARMSGSDDAVVNFDDARAAVRARMLRGAQLVGISSPWAPYGPAYDAYKRHFGNPTRTCVFVRAPGWAMNPIFWTPDRCDALRRSDPDIYMTDCAAEFATEESALLSVSEVDRATRVDPIELPPVRGAHYTAAIDPATRGNAWGLVIATREGRRRRVVLAREWIGSRLEPLSPRAVMGEIAQILAPYGIKAVDTDQWSGDALRDIAREEGFQLVIVHMTERQKFDAWMSVKTKLSTGDIELTPHPQFQEDLKRLKKRTLQSGSQVFLPRTPDGRHCDLAPPFLLAMRRIIDDVDVAPREETQDERIAREIAESKARLTKIYGRKARR